MVLRQRPPYHHEQRLGRWSGSVTDRGKVESQQKHLPYRCGRIAKCAKLAGPNMVKPRPLQDYAHSEDGLQSGQSSSKFYAGPHPLQRAHRRHVHQRH